jgi:sulfotransferase family protein
VNGGEAVTKQTTADHGAAPGGGQARSAAYRGARWAWRSAGTLTAPARMLPDFLIVGGQRCGTTSLFEALAQHPAVHRPHGRKGIHYFDVSYHRGMAWYRGHFPLAIRPAAHAVTGESSPYYMFHPLAAERIARDLPEVKLVVALRDPVERAYSAHAHESARGYETEPFARAIEMEPERLRGEAERLRGDPHSRSHSHRHHAYLARGRYIEQLERMEALVGRARIHVVDSGAYFAAPGPVFGALLGFLGLDRSPPIAIGRHNSRPRGDLAPALRRRLSEYYEPYDERLAQWLGRAPSWRT